MYPALRYSQANTIEEYVETVPIRHPLKQLKIQFELPRFLRVSDQLKALANGERVRPYEVRLNGIPAWLGFGRKTRDDLPMQIGLEDTRGHGALTYVQIRFTSKYLVNQMIPENFRGELERVIRHSCEYVNCFVENYRSITGSFWVTNIVPDDIYFFEFVGVDWAGEVDKMLYPNPDSTNSLGHTIRENEQDRLRTAVKAGRRASESQRFADSVLQLFHAGDYWSCFISAHALLESEVQAVVRELLEEDGRTKDEIHDEMTTSGRKEPKSTQRLLKNYVPQGNNWGEGVGSKAYQRWQRDDGPRDLRNDVAHGKKLTITRGDALELIQIVDDLFRALEDIVDNPLGERPFPEFYIGQIREEFSVNDAGLENSQMLFGMRPDQSREERGLE